MKVYIAGPYAARDLLAPAVVALEEAGHESTARWLDATHAITPGTINAALDQSDDYVRTHVAEDYEDIEAADAVLLYTGSAFPRMPVGSGGRHVETGYALGLGKPVVVVGEAENVFHRGSCLVAADLPAAVVLLDRLERWVAAS